MSLTTSQFNLLVPDAGSAAAPTLGFQNSSNAGFFLKADNSVGVSVGGSEVFTFTTSGGSESGPFAITGVLNVGVGTASTSNVINAIGPTSTVLTGVGQSAFNVQNAFNSVAATSSIHGFRAAIVGLDGSYTTADVNNFRGVAAVAGSGQTITRAIAAQLDMPTVGGTGNAILADNKTFTGNFGINLATTNASSLAGALTVAGQLIGKGTATNDSAAAGIIGEVLSVSRLRSAATAATTATTLNVTSAALSLTAGDWDVSGAIGFFCNTTTSLTVAKAAISKTSATLPAADTFAVPTSGEVTAVVTTAANVVNGDLIVPLQTTRISLSGTTSIFLVANATFSVSTVTVYGSLNARRVR